MNLAHLLKIIYIIPAQAKNYKIRRIYNKPLKL